jgi:hypothetical protein
MHRWLVASDDLREIVEAETAKDAINKVFTMFDDHDDLRNYFGAYISAIKVVGDEIFWVTHEALIDSGKLRGMSDDT